MMARQEGPTTTQELEEPPPYDPSTTLTSTTSEQQTPPPYTAASSSFQAASGETPARGHTSSALKYPPIKTTISVSTSLLLTLTTLRHGHFSNRPACLLAFTLDTTEPADRSTLFSAHCSLTFTSSAPPRSAKEKDDAASGDNIQIVSLLPRRLAGPKVKPTQAAYLEAAGSDTPYSSLRSAWQLDGEIKVANNGKGKGKAQQRGVQAVWDVTSDLTTTAPLPKLLRLGVIVAGDRVLEPGGLEVEVEVKAQRRSLVRGLMAGKGDVARGRMSLGLPDGEMGREWEGVVLREEDLKGCVSSMFFL